MELHQTVDFLRNNFYDPLNHFFLNYTYSIDSGFFFEINYEIKQMKLSHV